MPRGLTPLDFADSDKLNVGDTAIAIGAPLGLSGTVTNGIVSALNRSIDVASSAAPTTPDDSTAGRQRPGRQRSGRRLRAEPVRLLLRPAEPRRNAARHAAAVRRVGPGLAPGHPDGCRHQPGQLGWRAARLRGRAHRRQRRHPLGRRLAAPRPATSASASRSRRTWPSASRTRSSRTARPRTACSARRSPSAEADGQSDIGRRPHLRGERRRRGRAGRPAGR